MRGKKEKPPVQRAVRCAIYTRKSTEEGLEQEFNSLDAQREAGEAYVKSQQHEGWVCLPSQYDDGGFTGANMDRPAIRRLLHDIEAGKVDCVVVYKVDRLSRSLLDFARIMETFERHSVSFVSVTQAFNTATSMGRLVLNVLLSFAQFEREMISERTRDKIAAARRKGKCSGGMPVLGYSVVETKLVVDQTEADRVREIFQMYLERQSLLEVVKELNGRGWRTKCWTTRKSTARGGRPFNKKSLYDLLTNVAYIGKIRYKDEVHDGEQTPIVDERVFTETQTLLKRNGRSGGRATRTKHAALLRGMLAVHRLQLCDEPFVHVQGAPSVPLLRLPAGPDARLAGVPVPVDSRRRDRAVRGRRGQMRRSRSAGDQGDVRPGPKGGGGADRPPEIGAGGVGATAPRLPRGDWPIGGGRRSRRSTTD